MNVFRGEKHQFMHFEQTSFLFPSHLKENNMHETKSTALTAQLFHPHTLPSTALLAPGFHLKATCKEQGRWRSHPWGGWMKQKHPHNFFCSFSKLNFHGRAWWVSEVLQRSRRPCPGGRKEICASHCRWQCQAARSAAGLQLHMERWAGELTCWMAVSCLIRAADLSLRFSVWHIKVCRASFC